MNLTHDDVRDLAAGFVLGALTPEEEAAVRDHLSSCPEPHPEIEELGGVVPYLADSVEPVEPPVALRARILAAAAAERTPLDAAAAPAPAPGPTPVAPPAAAPAPAPFPPAVPFPTAAERAARDAARPSRLGTWAMGLVAVLAIAVLGAWNLQLQARISDVEGSLAAAATYQEGVANVLAVATRDGASLAILTPAGSSTTASGLAASGPDGTVVFAMRGLAPTAGTQVYEAWVIVEGSNPVALGSFKVGEPGTGTFEASTALATPGAILALTLEPQPGATAPTSDPVTVGTLGSSS